MAIAKRKVRPDTAPAFPEAYAPQKEKSKTGTVVGIEVDGTSVHMAVVENGVVTMARTYSGDDLRSSLAQWRVSAKRLLQRNPVRVAWSDELWVVQVDMAQIPDDKMADVAGQMVAQSVPIPTNDLMCALVPGELVDNQRPTTVIAVDRSRVAELWDALDGLKTTLHPSPFAFGDGLWLVSGNHPSMVLVQDGRPVQHRYFSSLAVADQQKMAQQMQLVAAAWSRAGLSVPDSVFPVGAHARDPGLADAVAAVALDLMAAPWPPGITSLDIPVADQASAYTAAAIAASTPSESAMFFDPAVLAKRRGQARRKRNRMIASAAGAVTVMTIGAGVYMLQSARNQLASANSAQAQATRHVESVRQYLSLQSAVQSLKSSQAKILAKNPSLEKKIEALVASAPSGSQMGSLSMTRTPAGAVVQMSAYLPGTSFAPVSAWVSSMEALGATVNLQSYSLTGSNSQFAGNAVSVQLTDTIT